MLTYCGLIQSTNPHKRATCFTYHCCRIIPFLQVLHDYEDIHLNTKVRAAFCTPLLRKIDTVHEMFSIPLRNEMIAFERFDCEHHLPNIRVVSSLHSVSIICRICQLCVVGGIKGLDPNKNTTKLAE